MKLTYQESYWDNQELKSEFIKFLIQIHNLDMTRWGKAGFWDVKYRPFSFFEGETLVSHLCIYSMEMMVLGERRKVAQVSAVGTLPEFRRQGLNFELTQKAMTWARKEHDFFFLFADEEALPFYKRCGFRMTDEYKTRIEVTGEIPSAGIDKLDIERDDHRELIFRYASERAPVSDELGVFNPKLFMFWCLYYLKDNIYHVPSLDILVLYKRKNGIVTVYDIVGGTIPEFSQVYPFICSETDEAVEFLFMIDKMNLEDSQKVKVTENRTHFLGNFPLEDHEFIFPYTAHA